MTTIRMTEAQARAAGLLPPGTTKTVERRPRSEWKTRCCTPDCGLVFSGETAERRHSDESHHNRFESILEES